MTSQIRVAAGAVMLFGVLLLSAAGAPPQIGKISTTTLKPGAAATITIDGADLAPNPRIVLPVPIASQTVKEPATAGKVQIELKLTDKAAPGVYQLRLGSDKGISSPVVIEIDETAPLPFGPQVSKLPATLQGTLSGAATLSTAFTGRKGQRLVVEVEARRLGSAIDPVIKLFDPKRLQVGFAQGSQPLFGDARLTVVLPADGTYSIELHDSQFKAGTPNRFRLRLGDWQYADLPFPLAGQRGSKASFQLIGNVPESTRVEADLTGLPGGWYMRLPRAPSLSGLSPRVLVSDLPEVVEMESAPAKLQEVALPAGINGRIRTPKEEDRYRLKVQPGAKLRLEVLAERAGSALDSVLVLRNEAGAQLARSDDQPGTLDPGLEYTVPDGVTAVVAAVTDLHGRGGPTFVYRLTVAPADRPDFSLALLDDRPHVPRGGAALVRVRATRTGYLGPIKLTLAGLPPGVSVSGDEIPAGATVTLLSFTAPEGTKPGQAVLQVVGQSSEPTVDLQRVALLPETPLSRVQPWLRGELAVAVIDPGPLTVSWEIADTGLKIGAAAAAKVTLTRPPDAKGNVRLTIVTSQVVPLGKGAKEDIVRALRLEGTPTVAAGQTTAEVKIVVPADLPAMPYDLALRAELLSPDNKIVLATATTPARRFLAAK